MHNNKTEKIPDSSFLGHNRNQNGFARNSNSLSIVALQNATGLVNEIQNTLKYVITRFTRIIMIIITNALNHCNNA